MGQDLNQVPRQESQSKTQKELKFNSSFFKFASIMIAMVIVGLLASYIWQTYFSPQAQQNRQLQEQYKKYQEFEAAYKQAMTNDTYGGKTPQETLDLFVAALEKDDLELASKYFILNSAGQRDERWLRMLQDTEENGRIEEVIDLVSSAVSAGSAMDGVWGYELIDKYKVYIGDINLKLNTYSQVWKIESL